MMSNLAIQVQGVSKKYCRTLSRTLVYGVKDVTREVFGLMPESEELRRDEFWALKEISFEVKRGECLGLIGANGAGKSTLLRLLNGVILADTGTVRVHGRIGALLELGAGFHPMLTGRENIHLTGAILGLSRREIEKKFDNIVEFADLREFIDTPVKYYSSGMYVRLGFSVAISTDPDILIVDEALAVGDIAFRSRCLERINAFITAGKTILFVTHNLQELSQVTHRTLLLDHGVIKADGNTSSIATTYLRLLYDRQRHMAQKPEENESKPPIQILEVNICGQDGSQKGCFNTHDELRVHIKYNSDVSLVNPVFKVQFFRADGLFCHGTNTNRHDINLGTVEGAGDIIMRCPDLGLIAGDYSIRVAILHSEYDESVIHQVVVSPGIHVESKTIDGAGVFAMSSEWITIKGN